MKMYGRFSESRGIPEGFSRLRLRALEVGRVTRCPGPLKLDFTQKPGWRQGRYVYLTSSLDVYVGNQIKILHI